MILFVSLVVIVAIVFLSGPRVRIDQTIFPKKLPLNLDDYLVLQEQEVFRYYSRHPENLDMGGYTQ